MMLWRGLWQVKVVLRIITFIAALFVFSHLYPFHPIFSQQRLYDTRIWASCPGSSPFDQNCSTTRAQITSETQIVVKTGGTEPQNRLHSQLATLLSKVPLQNLVLFSDLDESVGSHIIHDVFRDESPRELSSYPEFALYYKQLKYSQDGRDTRGLPGGWDLAKYQNLAGVRRLWKMQQDAMNSGLPTKKWFVFIDTDTYIEWDNLFAHLEYFDSSQEIYMGSPIWLSDLQYAHGGSAYVLSYGAIKALNAPSHLGKETPFASQLGLNVTVLCCGDEALARVLKTKGIKLKGYWPMFNGETPVTIPFGSDIWCEPVISLHHLDGAEMEDIWNWVEKWKAEKRAESPLLFKDLFEYVLPQIPQLREEWDNSCDGWNIYPSSKVAHASFERCQEACQKDRNCFQFVYNSNKCALSHHIRLGRKYVREAGESNENRHISGWNLKRIRDWTSKASCPSAHWVTSNP